MNFFWLIQKLFWYSPSAWQPFDTINVGLIKLCPQDTGVSIRIRLPSRFYWPYFFYRLGIWSSKYPRSINTRLLPKQQGGGLAAISHPKGQGGAIPPTTAQLLPEETQSPVPHWMAHKAWRSILSEEMGGRFPRRWETHPRKNRFRSPWRSDILQGIAFPDWICIPYVAPSSEETKVPYRRCYPS